MAITMRTKRIVLNQDGKGEDTADENDGQHTLAGLAASSFLSTGTDLVLLLVKFNNLSICQFIIA